MNSDSDKHLEIIVATTPSGVIGYQGKMPWHLPEDLKKFKEITMGGAIIMGRRTFESIGKALPGRLNIVLTRDQNFSRDEVVTATSLDEAFALAKQNKYSQIYVIGGENVFLESLPAADLAHVTLIESKAEGDTFFPLQKLKEQFSLQDTSGPLLSKSGITYAFQVWKRKHNDE